MFSTDPANSVISRISQAIPLAIILAAMAIIAQVRLSPFSLAIYQDYATLTYQRQPSGSTATKPPSPTAAADSNDATTESEIYLYTTALLDAKTFAGDDGRLYPIISNHDSYYWLRAAQQILETGSPCDEIVDSHCRDNLSLAPFGTDVTYGYSLHTYALAYTHRIASWFRPGIPIEASAILLPTIISMLGCVPAFGIGTRIGGVWGGLVAAFAIGLSPTFLARSGFGDNDVWNVVLPLFTLWLVLRALDAVTRTSRIVHSLIAACIVGLHATIWSGWLFMPVTIVAGLAGGFLFHLLQSRFSHEDRHAQGEIEFRKPTSVLIWFLIGVVTCVSVAAALNRFVTLPGNLDAIFHSDSRTWVDESLSTRLWPDSFTGVSELRAIQGDEIGQLLHKPWIIISMVGVYLLLSPTRRFERWDLGVLAWLALCGALLTRQNNDAHGVVIAALALPALLALQIRLRTTSEHPDQLITFSLIVLATMLAALYMLQSGARFLLLVVVPYGILCAALVGGVKQRLSGSGLVTSFQHVLIAGAALGLILPLYSIGSEALASELMMIDNAWRDTFQKLRTAPLDSIINTTWEFGHFAKFNANRRVITDGASIRAHVNHWFTRALAIGDEYNSVGLLRMINCGSDTLPFIDGKRGAYAVLRKAGLTESETYSLVSNLGANTVRQASQLLQEHNLPRQTVSNVLSVSHCNPPPVFLVVNAHMLRKSTFWNVGLWDQRKAEFFEQASPTLTPFAADWNDCELTAPVRCNIATLALPPNWGTVEFTYTPGAEADGILSTPNDAHSAVRRGKVASVFVAQPEKLDEHINPDAEFSHSAVLIDPVRQRVFLAPRAIIVSTLAQLVLLDGRYLHAFKKYDQHRSLFSGEITTWKVDFDALTQTQ